MSKHGILRIGPSQIKALRSIRSLGGCAIVSDIKTNVNSASHEIDLDHLYDTLKKSERDKLITVDFVVSPKQHGQRQVKRYTLTSFGVEILQKFDVPPQLEGDSDVTAPGGSD